MKNKIKKIGIGIGAIVILLGARTVFSEPGSETDPLVTLSYVEKKIEQVKYYIDERIRNIGSDNQNTSSWQVVDVPAGSFLICKDGTEIILRAGEAKSISKITEVVKSNGIEIIDNGLTDVTAGRDLKTDENIMRDHLLIVPRDDGRGAKAIRNSTFLVKGKYEIR